MASSQTRKNVQPFGVKWVVWVKKDNMGKIVRHKTRLVVKGCAQKYEIDYEEMFSPISRLEYIRILIAIDTQVNWELYHLDINKTFLNGEIDEDIHITQ